MKCLICGAECDSKHGELSTFARERYFDNRIDSIMLHCCSDCGFSFYDRPTDEDMVRYYTGYRGPEYQQMRQRHEPSYTPEFNAALNHDVGEVASRHHFMDNIIGSPRSVIDYGGDDGSFIPESATKRVVYDIGGNELVAGVERWDGKDTDFDMVMCCQVLEHVLDPRAVYHDARRLGRQMYLEIPLEEPTRLHEHINFFTPESFKRLTGVYPTMGTIGMSWGVTMVYMGALCS